jgi:hypothetical protein
MEKHLQIIGALLIILSILHLGFPKYFEWKKQLKSLALINKQMMEVHTFFIALTVFLMGLLLFNCSNELLNTNLGRVIILGLTIFWGIRFLIQLFVYSPKLWKGKVFETAMHIVFTIFWAYATTVFFVIYFILEV